MASLSELIHEEIALSLPGLVRPPPGVVQRVVELVLLRLSHVEGLAGVSDGVQLASTGSFARCARCAAIFQVVDMVSTEDGAGLACVECAPPTRSGPVAPGGAQGE